MNAPGDLAAALAAGLADLPDYQLAPLAERLAVLLPAPEPARSASPFVTVREAAELLRLPEQGIRDRLADDEHPRPGKLRRYKHGSRVLLRRVEVEAAVTPASWPGARGR